MKRENSNSPFWARTVDVKGHKLDLDCLRRVETKSYGIEMFGGTGEDATRDDDKIGLMGHTNP